MNINQIINDPEDDDEAPIHQPNDPPTYAYGYF